jgi:WNK lysine deficient protein kinase
MTVLEMLTLEYPYSECTNAAQIYRKVSDGIKPAAFQGVAEDNTIRRNFILRCIANDPKKRATVPQLLQHDFLTFAAGDSLSARESSIL